MIILQDSAGKYLDTMPDAISCTVTEERNGGYELVMQYPVSGLNFGRIGNRCILVVPPAINRSAQPFRIYRISKPMNGVVTVYAHHLSYDLSGVIAAPFEAGSAVEAMSTLKTGVTPENSFTMWTNISRTAKMGSKVPVSVRRAIGGMSGSILDVYGGELEFDGKTVKLWESRGADNGVTIRYGKNLTDLVQDENCAGVRTGIYPYWTNTEESVLLPEKVINAPGTYNFKSILPVDFSSDFKDKPTVDQLRAAAKAYVATHKIGVPVVSLKVSYVDLDQADGYTGTLLERVNLCDTVSVEFPEMGVRAKAKVVKTVYNVLLSRFDSVEIGEPRITVADTLANQAEELKDVPTKSSVQSAASAAAGAILGASGGNVRLLDTNGDGNPDTLYIADDPDPAKAVKVWRFNYEGWGASKNGYNGPFTVAATLSQGLYADFMTTGTLDASLIKAGVIQDKYANVVFNLDSGTLKINSGSINLGYGNFKVSSSGYLEAVSGNIGGLTISRSALYNDAMYLNSAGLQFDRVRNGNRLKVGSFAVNWDLNDPNKHGIAMDLEMDGSYIAFGYLNKAEYEKDPSNKKYAYIMKYCLEYLNSDYPANSMTFLCDSMSIWCPVNFHNNQVSRMWFDPHECGALGSITGNVEFVQVLQVNSNGGIALKSKVKLGFTNGILTSAFWSDLPVVD